MSRSFLPAPGTPISLGTGEKITPSTATTFSRVAVPSASEAVRLVSSTRRKLADLPAMPKQLNSYAVILVYTASGLSDEEISVATGFTPEQINMLRVQPAYNVLQEHILEAARNDATEEVKSIIRKGTVKAAKRVTEMLDSEDDKVVLMAAKDVLDRGGHAPKQQVDLRTEMTNTFRIEVVDRREAVAPSLVINHEE